MLKAEKKNGGRKTWKEGGSIVYGRIREAAVSGPEHVLNKLPGILYNGYRVKQRDGQNH